MLLIFNNITNASTVIDEIVATVNGAPITTYELKNIAPLYNAKNAKDLLNKVIDDYIIEQYAKNVGITVGEEQVEQYLKTLAHRNNLTVDQYIGKLQNAGIDIEELRRGIKLLVYRYTFARRVFLPTISISKKQIENYYKLHKDQFKNSTKTVVLSIITLKDLQTAQMIYNELKNGANFYDMLKKYSINKNLTREIPLMALNPYLQQQILSLKKGEFTKIIQAGGKYYIVKLVDIKQEGSVMQQVRNIMIEKQIEAKLKSWLKMIRARSDIEIYLK